MTRFLGRALATAAAVAAAGAAPAAAGLIPLPSPTAAFRSEPPLHSPGSAVVEHRLPGPVSAATAVSVVVDPSGAVHRVSALNRLLLRGTGDYFFAVQAPVTAAIAGPRSESTPGLRRGAVLWQGFSAKRRLLVARVELAHVAARALPIRISAGDGHATIENATEAAAAAASASADPRLVAERVAAARAALEAHQAFGSSPIPVVGGIRTVALRILVPVRVSGLYRFGSGRVQRFAASVGRRPLRLSGTGPLTRLEVTARPLTPLAALGPRTRLGPNAVVVASTRLLRAALATQYQTFLANPDSFGVSSTKYRFVLGASAQPLRAARGGGSAWWPELLLALGLAGALTAGVVFWAHS